uniref:Copiatype polyprotein putative n=1 Tax=Albugo laibachii Nc14 TaxID=890382 RepID=F0WIC1_9STRA|nr:copiatype polyprotein putative [Albugo laibachii Nc14]|eukprot:CCA21002.1 copiatype polyprotein putative [Albugo laibachii Nc14]
MECYMKWAERKHGHEGDQTIIRDPNDPNDPNVKQDYLVRQVLTDKGQQFCNGAMEIWFPKKGIMHTKVGTNTSQLNLVERTHQTLIGMVKTMMHQSGLPRWFWVHALENAAYIKNSVYCKGAGCTTYEALCGSKSDIHHVRSFGFLTYCHVPVSKRKKLSMNCRMGFLLDVKINKSIKYKNRHESTYPNEVKRWLQTFDGFIDEEELDDLTEEDPEIFHQMANCDAKYEECAASNVDMESEENCDDVYMESAESCKDTISGGDQRVETPSDDLDCEEKLLWEDILSNSVVPEFSDFDKLEKSNAEEREESQNGEFIRDEVESLPATADDTSSKDDEDEEINADAHDDTSLKEDDDEEINEDVDNDLEDWDAESVGHVKDLATVYEDVDSLRDDGYIYDYLIDRSEECESESDQITKQQLAEPYNQLIGQHRRPRGVEFDGCARGSVLSGVKNGLLGFEDHKVYSTFETSHVDRRGQRGLHRSDIKIPKNYRQAMQSKHEKLWREEMDTEMTALKAKEVLGEIMRSRIPPVQQTIRTIWVFHAKTDQSGYVVRFKARVVARGDKQRPGIDFKDTFSHVARMATFRIFIAVCIIYDSTVYQGDINTAYLNASLSIKQFLEEIEGYPCSNIGMVCIIDKALYGLRQSGIEWNTEVNRWFIDYVFVKCETEPCLYFHDRDGEFTIVLLYVDGIFCATKNVEFKNKIFEQLDKRYGLKDQGLLSTYLGVQVEQTDTSIKIHQTKYCQEIIERFNFINAHSSRIPMETNTGLTVVDTDMDHRKQIPANGKTFPYPELIGSLMYLATCTRPDLAFPVGWMSRYVQNRTQQHIGAAKRVLRYLIGTMTQRVVYSRNKEASQESVLVIDGYCDSDWGNDPDTRKSITVFVHCLAGGAISWASRRQSIVAQSTAEAEYVAACEACMGGQGLRNILLQVFADVKYIFRIGIDNQAAYVMATNPTYSRRRRRIKLRWHYVRDQVAKRNVNLWKLKTDVNPSDIMTQALASEMLERLSSMVGLLVCLDQRHQERSSNTKTSRKDPATLSTQSQTTKLGSSYLVHAIFEQL